MVGTLGTTSSTTMKSLGEIEQRALAVGAKMWCLYVFFVTLRGQRTVRSRGYTLSMFRVTVYGSIVILFFNFFSEVIALSDALDNSYFRC